MPYVGRLIYPIMVELAVLDTSATDQPSGDYDSGYDDIFREPRPIGSDGKVDPLNPAGECARKETICCLPAQHGYQYLPTTYEQKRMTSNGVDRSSLQALIFHTCDLKDKGLLCDDNKQPILNEHSRLVAYYKYECGAKGECIQRFNKPLYICSLTPKGGGMSGHCINLWLAIFQQRNQSVGTR